MNFVETLASFVDAGTVATAPMRDAEEMIGKYRLRILCITLLEWLSARHRTKKLRPLQLKSEYSCDDLRQLMDNTTMFEDVLEIRDDMLEFSAVLSDESRLELCAIADRMYNPPLRKQTDSVNIALRPSISRIRMLRREEAVRLARSFVVDELGYELELFNVQHVDRDMLCELLARPSLAASEAEREAILLQHVDHWEVSFGMKMRDGTSLDSSVVVRVEDDGKTVGWLAE